ncbi:hypothetical protein [Pendulispora albinea]|uniref:Adhesin domain-containing protein n=1 Tax=Pendulispora albinea TaxID=2741071 RepID=A0ABZ2M2E3_9BACT
MIAPEDKEAARSTHCPLVLEEHPLLHIETQFAQLDVVPSAPGETPFIALVGERIEGLAIAIDPSGGITRVRVLHSWKPGDPDRDGGGNDDENGWNAAFWENVLKATFHARVIAHVPPSVRARLRSAAARVHVERLSGCDLSIESQAASISLGNVSGKVRLETRAGRIDGHGLAGSFDVTTHAGVIRLGVRALDPGTHRVRGSDAVRVELAPGIPLQIHARTPIGSPQLDYPSVTGAPIVLDVEAKHGEIQISPPSQ